MKDKEFYPLEFKDKRKEKIQKESYQKWVDNNYNGVIILPTATGKSMLGLMSLLKHRHLTKLFVIVPKIDLLNQWYEDIVKYCEVDKQYVGRIGGGFKEDKCPITIAVIDSIRDKLFSSELLIIDEMHKAFGDKNSYFLRKGSHKRVLGLSATIERDDNKHIKFLQKYPIVYSMTQKDAVDKGLISTYKIVNIGCELLPNERNNYDYNTRIIKEDMKHFDYDLPTIINNAKFGNDSKLKQLANGILRAIRNRKTIIGNSVTKLDKTIELIKQKKDNKILVFCEYIKTADYIIKQLKKEGIIAGKFHSKMKSKEKQELFDKFKNNNITTMIAVKSLDEGTNIPDCDMGILIGGSSVQRQIVQRIGRIIRMSKGKDYATLYQIYCIGTKDEDWTKQRTKFIKDGAIEVTWIK